MTRATMMADTVALQARVDKIAEGAAMMTETTYEKIFVDGCSNTVPNHTLEALVYETLKAHGAPTYTGEELEYAAKLKATFPQGSAPDCIAARYDSEAKAYFDKMSEDGKRPMCDFIAPLYKGDCFSAGSTDVGDVSWQTPTVQLYTATYPAGSPGHSWQNVAFGKTTTAHKGMLLAAEVLAESAVKLFENPDILEKAKAEFSERAKSGYVCPIPDGEKAKIVNI